MLKDCASALLAQVERQIRRLLGKNSRAAGLFDICVDEIERDGRPGLSVTKHEAACPPHILFNFLANAMWKALEGWMAHSQLGHGVRTVIEEIARIKLSDGVLPTTTGRRIRLRCATDADEPQRVLLSRLGLKLPERLGELRWLRDAKVVPN